MQSGTSRPVKRSGLAIPNRVTTSTCSREHQRRLLGNRRWAGLMTLDPDELPSTTRDRLTRSFTEQECIASEIDRCRSREEMRSGA